MHLHELAAVNAVYFTNSATHGTSRCFLNFEHHECSVFLLFFVAESHGKEKGFQNGTGNLGPACMCLSTVRQVR